jgi:hypothetical protein
MIYFVVITVIIIIIIIIITITITNLPPSPQTFPINT